MWPVSNRGAPKASVSERTAGLVLAPSGDLCARPLGKGPRIGSVSERTGCLGPAHQ